jgi:hypothetical protein
MGQPKKLVYSFVARGTVVLADHAEVSGNFASVAAQCLQKLPTNNNRFSYNCDGHTFNYHVHDGFSNAPSQTHLCHDLPIRSLQRSLIGVVGDSWVFVFGMITDCLAIWHCFDF